MDEGRSADDPSDYSPDEEKELKVMLDGFFATYESSKKDFAGATLTKDSSVYTELLDLKRKLEDPDPETPLAEEEAAAQLKAMDFKSVNINLEVRSQLMSQQVQAVVEELVRLPQIPHKDLDEIAKLWHQGTKNSLETLTSLHEMNVAEKVPSYWMDRGAEMEEEA